MTLKVLSFVGKISSFVAGLSIYAGALPVKYAIPAGLVFVGASVLKDAVNRVGDFADDGKENGSWNADKEVS